MKIYETLKSLNVPDDTVVTISTSEGTDVFVHNETDVDTAMAETSVIDNVAELITTPGVNFETQWGENPIESLREQGFFDDYERGDFAFTEFVSDVIRENFYDQEFVESSTEKYDHKRGFCTLSATFNTTVGNLLSSRPLLIGWNVSVPTENGTLTLD